MLLPLAERKATLTMIAAVSLGKLTVPMDSLGPKRETLVAICGVADMLKLVVLRTQTLTLQKLLLHPGLRLRLELLSRLPKMILKTSSCNMPQIQLKAYHTLSSELATRFPNQVFLRMKFRIASSDLMKTKTEDLSSKSSKTSSAVSTKKPPKTSSVSLQHVESSPLTLETRIAVVFLVKLGAPQDMSRAFS